MRNFVILFNLTIITLIIYLDYRTAEVEYISQCCKSEYKEVIYQGNPSLYCLDCKKWCELEKGE